MRRTSWDGPIGDPTGGVSAGGMRRIYQDPVSALVGGGAMLLGGSMSSDAQTDAANTAANAQMQSAKLGIDQQNKQFEAIQKLLAPYVQAGSGALTGQQDLIGLNGTPSQQAAINGISSSPLFAEMQKQGENAILQNASATGGLRGGNTQGALAQFRPALLSQLIDQQYQRLGGLTSLGQNAAAGVGNAGMSTGNQISGLLGQQGAAQAGAALAGGRASSQMINGITGGFGQFVGSGGLNGFGQAPAYNNWATSNMGVLDSAGLSPAMLTSAF